MKKAEFDLFAIEYASMHEESLGAFRGEQDYFARYKIADVAREFATRGLRVRSILDFGAGCGNSIRPFREFFPKAALTCLDVSEESLRIASDNFPAQAEFLPFDGTRIPKPAESYDLSFCACVFHHIDHAEHVAHLTEMHRVLRDDGLAIIFEHNPFNPVTRRIVNQCPFDANAHLLTARMLTTRLRAAGFVDVVVRYRLFFPNVLRALRPLERFLRWLPLGGQYYAVGRKPATL